MTRRLIGFPAGHPQYRISREIIESLSGATMHVSARMFLLTALSLGALLGFAPGVNAAPPAASSGAATTSATSTVQPTKWDPLPLKYYYYLSDCEFDGLNGQHKRWWRAYWCRPEIDGGYMLFVDYY